MRWLAERLFGKPLGRVQAVASLALKRTPAKTLDDEDDEAAATAARLFREQRWLECLHLVESQLTACVSGGVPNPCFLGLRIRLLGFHFGREREALALARETVIAHPGEAELWFDLGLVEVAAGSLTAAFRAIRMAGRQGHDRDQVARELFRILMHRQRHGAARRLQPFLNSPPGALAWIDSFRAELALLERDADGCLAILNATGNHVAASTRSAMHHRLASLMRAEIAAGDTMAGIRHIAICGVSYVGSTVFGMLLGSAPGVAFAGETHHLTQFRRRTRPGGETIVAQSLPSDSPRQWPVACRVCGRACPVFTPEFRLALASNPTGFYAQIADRLGTRILVTSDKNFGHYWRHDPLLRYDKAILYKSPEQQVRSMLKQYARKGASEREPPSASTVRQWLDKWAKSYLATLRAPGGSRRRAVIDWESFAARPREHLAVIVPLLDLPVPDADLTGAVRLGHFCGGNSAVQVTAIGRAGRIVLRPSNAPALPEDIRETVATHAEAGFVSRLLDMEYRRNFGVIARR